MQNKNTRPANDASRPLKLLIGILSIVLVALLALAVVLKPSQQPGDPLLSADATTTTPTTEETTEATTEPTEPPMQKIATATIGTTGDILMHERVLKSGLDSATGQYDYTSIFEYFAPYVQEVDYGVGNMEGTLCGADNGYKYSGYPCFNCPDAIVDAAKAAGFDMLLTANNHAYDTRHAGLIRTQQVIAEKGLDYTGTMPDAEAVNYLVKDINGIRVGMSCYTYQTGKTSQGNKTINGISMTAEDSPLINSFDYNDLDSFYAKLGEEISEMKQLGAESIVVFIHWGDEYKTSPNSWQKKIGQQLCNMGVDVIVGGHAHVVQPIEVLTNENDPDRNTLCLYSLGNAVSNIRYSSTRPAETEDGMLFTFTLAKYSDGSVIVEGLDVLSTWVNRHNNASGKEVFPIIPLDPKVEDWKTAFNLTDSTLAQAEASLKRSQKILSEGLATAQEFYARQQQAHEEALGMHQK